LKKPITYRDVQEAIRQNFCQREFSIRVAEAAAAIPNRVF